MRSGRGKDLVMGTIYRTPSSEENNDLICDLLRLNEDSTRDKQLIVCGDFNFGTIVFGGRQSGKWLSESWSGC